MCDIENSFLLIAEILDKLPVAEDPVVSYDLLSDALVWSDEFPDVPAKEFNERFSNVRFLFRYRTSLIIQEPDERYELLWRCANELFPNWPGLRPDRRLPKTHLIELFRKQRSDAFSALPDD
jgi:hypothetical protein